MAIIIVFCTSYFESFYNLYMLYYCHSKHLRYSLVSLQMAIMVFKRSVYETRRKPKALLRPKTRANLKEASHVRKP